MRGAFVIAWKDLKQRLRDRSAIIAAFVAPLVLAFIVSSAFGSGFGDTFGAHYLVVDNDKSELSKTFAKDVLGAPEFRGQVTTATAASADEARAVLDRGGASAAFVFPEGFFRGVLAKSGDEIV